MSDSSRHYRSQPQVKRTDQRRSALPYMNAMGVPSRRVTDREMTETAEIGLNRLAKERGMTRQEIDRRVTECHLPFNPMRPLGHAIQAERRAKTWTRKELAERSGIPLVELIMLERGNLQDLSLASSISLLRFRSAWITSLAKRVGRSFWTRTPPNRQAVLCHNSSDANRSNTRATHSRERQTESGH